jgi:type II secretory pathway component PulF
LKFLWRLFLEAKLREVYRLVARGIRFELALSTAGLAEEHLHQMARYATAEKRIEILLRLARNSGLGRSRIAARMDRSPSTSSPLESIVVASRPPALRKKST